MPSPTQITPSQLARLLGTPGSPAIIDVRIDEDFAEDPRLVPASARHGFHDIASLAARLNACRVVVVCQKGEKLSQGAAALLRSAGVRAETLEGGFAAWREAGECLVPASAVPAASADGHTLWVTRHRPKIDRVACPWLIRRFVDPGAVFLFVEPSQVRNVAERFSATPFDVEDVFWSHRGDHCTFDTMLEEFGLATPPLLRLANVVRGADTNRHALAPECSGLLAASLGLSHMYDDDLAQLDAGLALYDAFYRWARDDAGGEHGWAPARDAS